MRVFLIGFILIFPFVSQAFDYKYLSVEPYWGYKSLSIDKFREDSKSENFGPFKGFTLGARVGYYFSPKISFGIDYSIAPKLKESNDTPIIIKSLSDLAVYTSYNMGDGRFRGLLGFIVHSKPSSVIQTLEGNGDSTETEQEGPKEALDGHQGIKLGLTWTIGHKPLFIKRRIRRGDKIYIVKSRRKSRFNGVNLNLVYTLRKLGKSNAQNLELKGKHDFTVSLGVPL